MSRRAAKIAVAAGITSVILIIVLTFSFWQERLSLNLLSLDAVHRVLKGQPFLENRSIVLKTSPVCPAHWVESFIAAEQGDLSGRNDAYRQAVACDPDYVGFLHSMYPQDLEMAQMVLQEQPNSAESWFWVGDLTPEEIIEYYRRGLAIDPKNGRRWIILGDSLKETDSQAALLAYLQGCYNGDPGYNGCVRAGSIAEKLGDYQAAIQYYRLSSYPPYRVKADEIEKAHPELLPQDEQ